MNDVKCKWVHGRIWQQIIIEYMKIMQFCKTQQRVSAFGNGLTVLLIEKIIHFAALG